jgi:hypothetical protein
MITKISIILITIFLTPVLFLLYPCHLESFYSHPIRRYQPGNRNNREGEKSENKGKER